MSRLKVELNSEGVRQLLKSEEMKSICEDYASAALGRLGTGYVADSHVGPYRVNAMVYAETNSAQKENMENNSILKVVMGG